MLPRLLAGCLLALFGSCYSSTHANLEQYFEGDELLLTEGKAPEGAEPLKILSVYKSGFYLFGVAPIVGVDLQETMQMLCDDAKRMGADGIAHISFEYNPASMFKFTLFPLPDWSSSIHVQGMAWRRPGSVKIRPTGTGKPARAGDFPGEPGR